MHLGGLGEAEGSTIHKHDLTMTFGSQSTVAEGCAVAIFEIY